jgi:hypothetical protein
VGGFARGGTLVQSQRNDPEGDGDHQGDRGTQRPRHAAILSPAPRCETSDSACFWAFVYNAIGVLVAAGVLYPLTGTLIGPIWASAKMTLSSVSVIGNALRLWRAQL